ncbi:MAG: CHAD domain-containing protein [Novosphingobium sp.]
MTETRPIELELKLEAARDDLEALAGRLAVAGFQLQQHEQRSIYFDSPGNALRTAGLSLRIRESAGRRIQTIKAEGVQLGGLFARPEWETVVSDDTPVIDDATGPLRSMLPENTLNALAPVFTISVGRRSGTFAKDGAPIEAAVDLGQIEAGERMAHIAEIELELKEGPPAAVFAIARSLADVAPVKLGVLAKSERGYRLLDGSAHKVAKAVRPVFGSSPSAAEMFAAIVAACLRHFRLNEDLVTGIRDAEALHQARVALRRLRSALSIFKPIILDDRFEHLRIQLRWLAGTLGDAREIDVLVAAGESAASIDDARQAAYANVEDALGSARARALMLDLVEWTAIGRWRVDPAEPSATEQPAQIFAIAALERLRRKLKKRGANLAELDDDARHQVRIEAKKLRYAAEFFADLFADGKAKRRAKRFVAAVQGLQERLGDLNDIANAPALRARLGLPVQPGPGPQIQRRIKQAAQAYEELIGRKRFWR